MDLLQQVQQAEIQDILIYGVTAQTPNPKPQTPNPKPHRPKRKRGSRNKRGVSLEQQTDHRGEDSSKEHAGGGTSEVSVAGES